MKAKPVRNGASKVVRAAIARRTSSFKVKDLLAIPGVQKIKTPDLPKTVGQALSRLAAQGFLEREGLGLYRVSRMVLPGSEKEVMVPSGSMSIPLDAIPERSAKKKPKQAKQKYTPPWREGQAPDSAIADLAQSILILSRLLQK